MNKEKDLVVLTSLVAIGIIVASGLAATLQTMIVFPVALFGLVMFPLLWIQTTKKGVHLAENLEKIVFLLTLFIIAISFAILYVPV
ncbi:hypothetical protein MBCUT_07400 [Methanobrevibacter cuticularis]|uniref:Uncharacterized protein n=1 Tax=Methanobrevibacter cuticularis TaxID=47311 RepID=A0A166EFD8_9EURY|nr:hypothetical protein [Methanobrevibacter cuticularis]KZX16586.1 hypothetical protein MBCUT_07400 [Methanobrevibacter cuticularis]